MKNEIAAFGQPERFQITLRWVEDEAPLARRPAGHGWSMGHLTITVAGVNLSSSSLSNDRQEHVCWYLGPMLHWLAENWVVLLHEERFNWATKDATPAAIACRRALDLWAGSEHETGRRNYLAAQAWYLRHGLRAAAAGELFPDLFIRRVADDIELSWTGEPPPFAPEGLTFDSGAGCARLAVEDVAEPLWNLLRWASESPPAIDAGFRTDWEALCARVDAISHLSTKAFETVAVADELLQRVRDSFAQVGRQDLVAEVMPEGQPFITAFSPAVAMFGGLSPNLSESDIYALRDLLTDMADGADSAPLAKLVRDRHGRPVGRVPYEDGYSSAMELLDDLAEASFEYAPEGYVEIRGVCRWLGIQIREHRLETDSIRGVAIAGEGFHSAILVNLFSPFNLAEDGKRFTIGHELCHILLDRTRARRIVHSSTPWAAPGIEKRANAFAAYLLMPPHLIRRNIRVGEGIKREDVRAIAEQLRVGETALVEHLYNFDFIDETQRETLRQHFRPFSLQ